MEREFKVPITEVKVYCARAQSKHLRTEITRVEKGRQQCTVLAPHCELLLKFCLKNVPEAERDTDVTTDATETTEAKTKAEQSTL